MKDKEQQINEMAKDIRSWDDCYDENGDINLDYTLQEHLYILGYRKLPEDSVVLSREELNDYLNLKDLLDKGYFTSDNRIELYKEYEIEERRYQRKLAHEKEDAAINKVNRERANRCKDCVYSTILNCGDGFKILGCFRAPYKGKWCIEIETCPKRNKGE